MEKLRFRCVTTMEQKHGNKTMEETSKTVYTVQRQGLWEVHLRTFAAYFCTFQLRPLQRDKSSCVPGTTSPRSTLFPASSLFLAFFFAPTFWLSFLPSQVFFICGSKGRALSTKTRMDRFAYVNLTFFFLSLSLTIYLSIYPSIHPCIHPSIDLSLQVPPRPGSKAS